MNYKQYNTRHCNRIDAKTIILLLLSKGSSCQNSTTGCTQAGKAGLALPYILSFLLTSLFLILSTLRGLFKTIFPPFRGHVFGPLFLCVSMRFYCPCSIALAPPIACVRPFARRLQLFLFSPVLLPVLAHEPFSFRVSTLCSLCSLSIFSLFPCLSPPIYHPQR